MKIIKIDKLDSELKYIGVGECYYDHTSETYNIKTDQVNSEEGTTLVINLDTGRGFYGFSSSPAQKIESQLVVSIKNIDG